MIECAYWLVRPIMTSYGSMSRLQSYDFQLFDQPEPRLETRRFKLFDLCSTWETFYFTGPPLFKKGISHQLHCMKIGWTSQTVPEATRTNPPICITKNPKFIPPKITARLSSIQGTKLFDSWITKINWKVVVRKNSGKDNVPYLFDKSQLSVLM